MTKTFESYPTVEAAERAARATSELELREALNNHAENLENLNAGYNAMFAAVRKQDLQISALLDGVDALTKQLEALRRG